MFYVVQYGWLNGEHVLEMAFDTLEEANEYANSIETKWGSFAVWTLVKQTEEAPEDTQCGICHEINCGGHLEGLPGNPYTICIIDDCDAHVLDGEICDHHLEEMFKDMEAEEAAREEREQLLRDYKEE